MESGIEIGTGQKDGRYHPLHAKVAPDCTYAISLRAVTVPDRSSYFRPKLIFTGVRMVTLGAVMLERNT